MRTVLLYGHLAQRFGKYHRFDVQTPAEAVRALSVNFKGFEQALVGHAPGYHVFRGKENLGEENLREPSGKDAIRIVPAIAGAKRGGILQIIAGVVLVVIGAVVQYALYGAPNPISSAFYQMGAAMIVGGVVTFLFAPPVPNANSKEADANNQPSYVFSGPVNTTAQGHPVPVGYGELEIGSAVVSGGIYVGQIGTNGNNATAGTATDPSTPPANNSDGQGGSLGGGVLRVGDALQGIAPVTVGVTT